MNHLICGPAGSGKTSYVRSRANPGDLVIDLDWIFGAITIADPHDHAEKLLPIALGVRDYLIETIQTDLVDEIENIWLIASLPEAGKRQRFADAIQADDVVVLECAADECMKNIMNDPTRKADQEYWEPIVQKWWANYTRRPGDTVLVHDYWEPIVRRWFMNYTQRDGDKVIIPWREVKE